MAQFTELVATAVANAQSSAELTASRRRIVETADETRRRIERDLHDGAQQRLVHTIITLKLARSKLGRRRRRRRRSSSAKGSATPSRRSRRSASWRAASTRRSSPIAGSSRR